MVDAPSRTCTWIGPDQDPVKHWPIHYCGVPSVPGKSYCTEHYHRVYIGGTALTGKKKLKALLNEVDRAHDRDPELEIENV